MVCCAAKPREEVTLSTKAGRLLVPQDPAGRMDESFICFLRGYSVLQGGEESDSAEQGRER